MGIINLTWTKWKDTVGAKLADNIISIHRTGHMRIRSEHLKVGDCVDLCYDETNHAIALVKNGTMRKVRDSGGGCKLVCSLPFIRHLNVKPAKYNLIYDSREKMLVFFYDDINVKTIEVKA